MVLPSGVTTQVPRLGRHLGSGKCREVYVHGDNPKYVVKVLKDGVRGHNRREWRVWTECEQYRQWLVPCISITEDGKYLVARRGKPIKKHERPRGYPACFKDAGASQWVRIGSKVLFADYGVTSMYRLIFGEDKA